MSTHKSLRVIMAQTNFLVGDIAQNTQKIIAFAKEARDELKGDVIIFPELALTAYPPEDLLLRRDFQLQTSRALSVIAQECQGIDLVIGFPQQTYQGLFNAAAVIQQGGITATYYKQHLPNYGVFDEKRYFITGHLPCIVHIKNIPIAITICEDLWFPDPIAQAKQAGAKIVFSLNASPFDIEKSKARENILKERIRETSLPVVYVHGVGAQDELIFDGGSMVFNSKGEICAHAGFYNEILLPVDFEINHDIVIKSSPLPRPLSTEENIYKALVLGVHDYIEKNKFPGAIIGLSGGIDSALTLAVAVDAIGKDRVEAVMLSSRYTSEMSLNEAKALADKLGVAYKCISIEEPFSALLKIVSDQKIVEPSDITGQNLQARCRAVILMALTNQSGKLLLSASNKSEMAAGYTTLYGDMCGGFAVLKDVYKTWVYRLVHYRNSLSPFISQTIIDRPPTAELAPNQTDQETLPPYSLLDKILELFIEGDQDPEAIIAAGYPKEVVYFVIQRVMLNEFKRRQAPPGVKVTPRAFGRDRRYPITTGFKPGLSKN
jgi:NAD+ synthase (glutamine-hydrolysing)